MHPPKRVRTTGRAAVTWHVVVSLELHRVSSKLFFCTGAWLQPYRKEQLVLGPLQYKEIFPLYKILANEFVIHQTLKYLPFVL
jgi:hypothetical protein